MCLHSKKKKRTDGKDSLRSTEVNQFCTGFVGRVVLVSVEIALRYTELVSRLSPSSSSLGQGVTETWLVESSDFVL